MLKLIRLEMKKINLKNYLGIASIIPIVVLVFTYLFACIPMIDPSALSADPEIASYKFILNIAFLLNALGFTFLGTTMIGRVILDAYSNRNKMLTLSYPVNRIKIFAAKMLLVSLFSGLLCAFSLWIIDSTFLVIEAFFPVVQDRLVSSTYLSQLPLLLISAIFIPVISICSLWIGWKKSSIPLTIFSGFILFALVSNSLNFGNTFLILIFTILYTVLALICSVALVKKVQRLEV